jgi:MscS family membrane protein
MKLGYFRGMKSMFTSKWMSAIFIIFVLSIEISQARVNLSTPYTTIESWIHLDKVTTSKRDASKLLPSESSEKSARLAVQLHQIIQGRGIVIKPNEIPNNPDFIDSTSGSHKYILNQRIPSIYLEKEGEKWHFSKETIEEIPRLHRKVYPLGANFLLNLFPYVKGPIFLGLELWQWIGLGLIILIFWLVIIISKVIFKQIIARFGQMPRYKDFLELETTQKLSKALSRLVAFFFLNVFIPALQLSPEITANILIAVNIGAVIYFMSFLFLLTELSGIYLVKMAKNTESTMDDQFVPVIKKIIKLFIFVSGTIVVLRILNVNVTAVIAGVSIGGLAFALAAQDTVKNLIGSIMIFADRPFKVGDYIKGSDIEGTVLEVGIRSTLIKTPLNSVIYIPNGRLADMTLDNKGKPPVKFTLQFEIPVHIPTKIIQHFKDGLIIILNKHAKVQTNSAEVYLQSLSGKTMVINAIAVIKNATRKEIPGVRSDLNLKCLEWAQQCHLDIPTDEYSGEIFAYDTLSWEEMLESLKK